MKICYCIHKGRDKVTFLINTFSRESDGSNENGRVRISKNSLLYINNYKSIKILSESTSSELWKLGKNLQQFLTYFLLNNNSQISVKQWAFWHFNLSWLKSKLSILVVALKTLNHSENQQYGIQQRGQIRARTASNFHFQITAKYLTCVVILRRPYLQNCLYLTSL